MRPSRRDELVSQALKIFYKNGFTATGMDFLVKETGISKTSMYKYFRSKDELILAVLRLRDEQFRNWFFRRAEELSSEPEDEVLAFFDVLKEWFEGEGFQGCMFIKAVAEFQQPDDPIYQQSLQHKKLIEGELFKKIQKTGVGAPESLTQQLMLLMEGAIVLAQMGVSARAAEDARDAARILLASALSATGDKE